MKQDSPRTDFATIPDAEQIAALPRDLKFYPSVVAHPQVLSAAQIQGFNESGFVRPLNLFEAAEIGEIRSYFDRLLQDALAAGRDSYSISSAHLKHGRVYDILTDERVVGPVADILGESVIGWGSHFFCKMPGDPKAVAWHQDASYWPLTPSKAVTVWLAIDDADEENGCVKFIAGSHHFGHLTYRPSDSHEHNVLNQTVDNAERYGTVVSNPLMAGQASLHSDLLLHGSEPNLSPRRRCGLTLRYCAADVRAHLEWNEKGVYVRGRDTSGHWSNRPRPHTD